MLPDTAVQILFASLLFAFALTGYFDCSVSNAWEDYSLQRDTVVNDCVVLSKESPLVRGSLRIWLCFPKALCMFVGAMVGHSCIGERERCGVEAHKKLA